jgi:hypothetical protein
VTYSIGSIIMAAIGYGATLFLLFFLVVGLWAGPERLGPGWTSEMFWRAATSILVMAFLLAWLTRCTSGI